MLLKFVYLGGQVYFRIVVVKKSLLSGEGADSHYSLQEFAEIGKNGATRIRLHSTQIAACVEVSDG